MSISPSLAITPSADVPARGTYTVDPERSQITFTTGHTLGLGKVSGSFKIRAGQLVIADRLPASTVRAEAIAGSFSTGSGRRDAEIRSRRFLDADRYPAIAFRSERVVNDGGTWIVHGILTACGNDAPLALTVTAAAADDGALDLQATGRADRYAHGVTALKGLVGRWLRLTVTVHAIRS
jgi:polyisoprenoid-binding protein YceI